MQVLLRPLPETRQAPTEYEREKAAAQAELLAQRRARRQARTERLKRPLLRLKEVLRGLPKRAARLSR